MNPKVLAYVVDDNNNVRPIPRSHYVRVMRGEEAIYLYAGRAIRFVETIVGQQPGGDEIFAHAVFPLVHFDAEGRRDKIKEAEELDLAQKAFASTEGGDWEHFYFTERDAAFRWKPDPAVLSQVRQYVPKKKTSWD